MAHSKQDPTGQAKNRKKAFRTLKSRLKKSERAVKAMFRNIPKTSRKQTVITNKQETVYSYDIDAQGLSELSNSITYELNNELVGTQGENVPFDWYYKDPIESSIRQGAVEETRDFTQEIALAASLGYFASRTTPPTPTIPQVLFSEAYRNRLQLEYLDNFVSIKGLSQDTSKQVYRVIKDGVSSGLGPTAISKQISTRFNVAESNAKRIADTSVNAAYNNSRLTITKELSDEVGLRSGVVHVSALIQTTRATHAVRHGNAYTVEDQEQWWDQGANRINCHCSTRSILIGRDGNPINTSLQQKLDKEKDFFQ